MREDEKLILEAYSLWRKENPDDDTKSAFVAGAKFVLNYLTQKERI